MAIAKLNSRKKIPGLSSRYFSDIYQGRYKITLSLR
jgi:hypothetical protein